MKKAGYGPDKRLKLKIATRGISLYKDPAVILAGQLKEIWIDAERRHHRHRAVVPQGRRARTITVGLNTTGNGVDDPDQNYFENFSCKSERNYTGYCNPEIEKLFDAQSAETDIDEAPQDRVGDRPQAAGGRRAADHHVEPRGDLHAALRQGLRARRSTASTTASASRTSGSTSRSGRPTPQLLDRLVERRQEARAVALAHRLGAAGDLAHGAQVGHQLAAGHRHADRGSR